MADAFHLTDLDFMTGEDISEALDELRDCSDLRQAVNQVITSIHGLPDLLECELRQIEVYLGRAGQKPTLVRARWKRRFVAFSEAPSAVAMALFSASTASMRNGNWERKAQRIISALEKHGGLCCSNAVIGDNGNWAPTRKSVIYLVARRRRGPPGKLSEDLVRRAVAELTGERGEIDAEVILEAQALILDPTEAETHSLIKYVDDDDDDDASDDPPRCKSENCSAPARRGNYGYCGRHRRVEASRSSELACKSDGCRTRAMPGNFGFCGFHRRLPNDACREEGCRFSALSRNYGFCGRHRS